VHVNGADDEQQGDENGATTQELSSAAGPSIPAPFSGTSTGH